MPGKMRYRTCQICGYRSTRVNDTKRVFMAKFPLNETRCKEWVRLTGKEDLAYIPIEKLHELKYLCGQHFTSKDFNKKKSRLKKFAIPSVNLIGAPLSDEVLIDFPCHVFSNTDISNEPRENACDSEAADNTNLGSRHLEPTPPSHLPLLHHDYIKVEQVVKSPPPKRKNTLDSDIEDSPHMRKLSKKLLLAKKKISSLKQGNILPRIKSSALQALIKAHIRNNKRKAHGKRFTSSEKALATAIYKKSPHAYRHLQRLITLPSVSTLRAQVHDVEIEPGVSPIILNYLRNVADKLDPKDKLCALLFDEIALTKQLIFNPRTDKVDGFVDLGEDQFRSSDMASHAFVFMLQGLNKIMKQTIAYYLVKDVSSQSLALLIIQVIKAVVDIGYTVITIVCDQRPKNIGCLNLLKAWSDVPVESNYFIVNAEKVFIMFDIPYLFKSLRNNFQTGKELVIDGKTGKWSHLIDVVEKNKSTLHFKKLTGLHVKPTSKAKKKVKLAAQILSNTVAAILKLMAEKYENDEKGKAILETAQIIEELDQLFDCTNGPGHTKDIIRNRRENVSKNTNHVELWAHYKNKLSTMSFLKNNSFLRLKNARCVQGYTTSLSTLEEVWKLLELKGCKSLNLRQLNQESLESLFGVIRKHCPTNRNPTCHYFTSALRSNILTKLRSPVGKGANFGEGENEAIVDFEDFVQHDGSDNTGKVKKQSSEILDTNNSLGDHKFPIPNILEEIAEHFRLENTLLESFESKPTVYVAGYLASVVLKKMTWQCDHCKSSLKIEIPELIDTTTYSYTELHEWWHDKTTLTYPTIDLCKLVDAAKTCFDLEIKHILSQRHITNQAVTTMLTKFDDLSWVCTEHRDWLLHIVLAYLSYILIRNECQRINVSLTEGEVSTADVNGKVQPSNISLVEVEESTVDGNEEVHEINLSLAEIEETTVDTNVVQQIDLSLVDVEESTADVDGEVQQESIVGSIHIEQIVLHTSGEAFIIHQ